MAQGQTSTVDAPDTLPPDFFDKKQGGEAPDTLPGDFFEKKAQKSTPEQVRQRNATPTQFEKENTPTFFGEAARTAAKIPFKAVGLNTNTESPVSEWLKQNGKYALEAATGHDVDTGKQRYFGAPKVVSDVKNQMDDLSREGTMISATGRSVEPAQANQPGAMQSRPGGPIVRSGQELSHPFLASAIRHAASNIPIIGPNAVHAGHALATATTPQETGEAVAEAGGTVGQAALGTKAGQEFTNKAIETIGKPVVQAGKVAGEFGAKAVKAAGAPYTVGVSGEQMLKKGLAPYAKQTGYDSAVSRATDDIVKYHRDTPINSVKDLDEAIPSIQKKIMADEIKPAVARHASEPLPPERMARVQKAVQDSISPFAEEFDAAAAKDARELAEKMGKSRTVGDLLGGERGGLLGYINGKLESYFSKYPSARKSDLMNNPETAGWEAARKSLREEVLGHLEDQGEAGMREARQRWGGLEELSKTTERRINVNDRAKPMSLSRILGLVGAAPTGGLSVIAGEVAHHLNKPDVLVRRGIERMAKNAPEISSEMGRKAIQAAKGSAELPAYKPSEKAATMGGERKNLGPEFEAGEVTHEIDRNKSILRNAKATAEDRAVARARLRELQAQP